MWRRHLSSTIELQYQQLRALHEMRNEHLAKQHASEWDNQLAYSKKAERELRKKHVLELKEHPKSLRVHLFSSALPFHFHCRFIPFPTLPSSSTCHLSYSITPHLYIPLPPSHVLCYPYFPTPTYFIAPPLFFTPPPPLISSPLPSSSLHHPHLFHPPSPTLLSPPPLISSLLPSSSLQSKELAIKKQYHDTVRIQQRQYKALQKQMMATLPKERQRDVLRQTKEEQMRKIAMLAMQYERTITDMAQQQTVRAPALCGQL